jgi:hypothetical protein
MSDEKPIWADQDDVEIGSARKLARRELVVLAEMHGRVKGSS